MNIFFLTLAALLATFAGTAGWLLVSPSDSPLHQGLERSREAQLATLPDPEVRSRVRARALATAERARPFLARELGWRRLDVRPAVAAAVVRMELAGAVLPLLAGLLVLGGVGGLLRRRFLMERLGFHSLTFSYLGKALLAISLGSFVWTGLSPIAPPIATLYAFSAAAAAGVGLYLGNLPPKL